MYSRKTEKQRGRLETREYYYTEEIEWLIKRNKEWKKVKGIGASINKNATRNLNILRKLAISILEELPFRKKFSRRTRRYIISKKIFKIIF